MILNGNDSSKKVVGEIQQLDEQKKSLVETEKKSVAAPVRKVKNSLMEQIDSTSPQDDE